ncbi:MAG: amino acid ABC transporter permease [Oscillospiraceae bacterium]|jgi:putative glutamine transport system permease protein|nr:amino acid ABC transporter permease [Oscillospiraceae bacterium]
MSRSPFALWRWKLLWEDKAAIFSGFVTTLFVSFLALLLALLIGIVFGMLGTSEKKPLRAINRVYVEFFQNIPLLVQVFFIYNAFPLLGFRWSVFMIGVAGVGIYHGAYVAEVIRAGIRSIPRGQSDAARSQGFNYLQTMAYVILPQTIKIILPPLTNQAVNLIKNTSVLATLSGLDLMYQANSWALQGTLSYGPAYVAAGTLYFLICFPLATWARRYERRIKEREHIQLSESAVDELMLMAEEML